MAGNNNIQQIKKRMEYYAQPVEWKKVLPVSAKTLFGRKWRTMVKKHMPAPQILAHASYTDGLTPLDLNLAAITVPQASAFKPGDKILLKTLAGDPSYAGTWPVLATDEGRVILPIPARGDAAGTISNETMRVKTHNAWQKANKKTAPAANPAPEKSNNFLPQINVGDTVQWESQGTYQFTAPRRVTAISADGRYAYVEGEQTAFPIEELVVKQVAGPAPGTQRMPQPKPKSNMGKKIAIGGGIALLAYLGYRYFILQPNTNQNP